MSATEEWRPIPGYEGFYEASSLGRVRSLDRRKRGRVLKPGTQTNGYLIVSLHKDARKKTALVHRLVMLAFFGSPPASRPMVRHLNGDQADNRLDNLTYGTASENELDKVRHGTHNMASKTHCPAGHEYSGDNLFYNPSGYRLCRACSRMNNHRQYRRRRAIEAEALGELPDGGSTDG